MDKVNHKGKYDPEAREPYLSSLTSLPRQGSGLEVI